MPPHVHINSLRDESEIGEGKADTALKFDKVAELEHERFNKVPPELVDQLVTRSEARRQSNPKFQKQNELIKKLVAWKQRKQISLNEEKFKSEYIPPEDDEVDPDKPKDKDKDKEKAKPKRRGTAVAWESNFYNDELISIVADYVTLGSKVLAGSPNGGKVAE